MKYKIVLLSLIVHDRPQTCVFYNFTKFILLCDFSFRKQMVAPVFVAFSGVEFLMIYLRLALISQRKVLIHDSLRPLLKGDVLEEYLNINASQQHEANCQKFQQILCFCLMTNVTELGEGEGDIKTSHFIRASQCSSKKEIVFDDVMRFS